MQTNIFKDKNWISLVELNMQHDEIVTTSILHLNCLLLHCVSCYFEKVAGNMHMI